MCHIDSHSRQPPFRQRLLDRRLALLLFFVLAGILGVLCKSNLSITRSTEGTLVDNADARTSSVQHIEPGGAPSGEHIGNANRSDRPGTKHESAPDTSLPEAEKLPLEYIERVFPNLRTLAKRGIHIERKPPQHAEKLEPPNVCLKAQFDAVRWPMTYQELLNLLGEPFMDQDHVGDMVTWQCEDGRTLNIRPTGRNDRKQSFSFNKSQAEKMRYGVAEFGELHMSVYRGMGRVRFFLIPERKPREIEEAIKQLGPRKQINAI